MRRDHVQWLSSLGLPTLTLETGNDIVEEILPFILADSTYVNIKHVVMTFRTMEIIADNIVRDLNQKLGAIWCHVENAFGILKADLSTASRMCSGGYSVCSSLNILHTHASQLLD